MKSALYSHSCHFIEYSQLYEVAKLVQFTSEYSESSERLSDWLWVTQLENNLAKTRNCRSPISDPAHNFLLIIKYRLCWGEGDW